MLLKPNTLLSLSSGCYSDYQIYAELWVLVEFDPIVVAKEYASEMNKTGEKRYYWNSFDSYLITKGYCSALPFDSMEINTGDYGFDLHNNPNEYS